MSKRGLVFFHRVVVALLDTRDLAAQRVQAVVIRIDSGGAFEELVRVVDGPDCDFSLRSGQLQVQVLRHRVGDLRVELCGIFLLAIELIGVGQFRLHIGPR